MRTLVDLCVITRKRGTVLFADGTWILVRCDGRVQKRRGVKADCGGCYPDVSQSEIVAETHVDQASHCLTLREVELVHLIVSEFHR